MARVTIVGDGPAGLSAALFLAKNGHDVTLYGQDGTPMHHAHLHNYLGVPDVDGSAFQELARKQVRAQGAELVDAEVTAVERSGEGFTVRSAGGEVAADYVVLAGGKAAQRLAADLGAEKRDGRVHVDNEYRTGADRVYAVGRVARPDRSQAIISAGAGATAALDILAREEGRDVVDWDSPPEG